MTAAVVVIVKLWGAENGSNIQLFGLLKINWCRLYVIYYSPFSTLCAPKPPIHINIAIQYTRSRLSGYSRRCFYLYTDRRTLYTYYHHQTLDMYSTLYFVLRRIHCFLFDYPYIAWRSMMENPFYDISFFSFQPLHTLLAAASCSLSHSIWVLSFLLFVQRVCTALYIFCSPGIELLFVRRMCSGLARRTYFFSYVQNCWGLVQ